LTEDSSSKSSFSSSEIITAMAHYYRGEVMRMNVWRQRLDVTTNWAIISTAAFLSFGFGSREIPHFVLILATIFVFFFLIIEARRYKYFDLWRWRVALINENFFATVISSKKKPQHSRFKMNFAEAFGRRLRRNYSWIFGVLAFCWITKVSIHPTPVNTFQQIVERAAVYHLLPGWLVIAIGVIFNLGLVITGIVTLKERTDVVRIYPSRKSRIKLPNI